MSDSKSKQSKSGMSQFDWSMSQNDSSLDSISDYDDYDPKMKKFSEEELKPQPVLRKSKKVLKFKFL